jgi:hypothetical protein
MESQYKRNQSGIVIRRGGDGGEREKEKIGEPTLSNIV